MKFVAWVAGILLLGSFAGALHPLGDSLAVVRLPLAVVFSLAVIWTPWRAVLRWPLAALGMAVLGQVIWMKLDQPEAGGLTLYQKNMLYRNGALDDLARDIRARVPDVVTLQEVSNRNETLLAMLAEDYPYQHLCRFQSWRGVAVLSRLEPVPGVAPLCSPQFGLAGMQVQGPEGPFWVVSLHLHWPFPFEQADHLERLVPVLEGLTEPVVLAGDFNMLPWGWSVRRVGQLVDGQRAGPLVPTYWLKGLVPLAIDHVFAPGGGRIEVLPAIGSDHNGLFARVSVD